MNYPIKRERPAACCRPFSLLIDRQEHTGESLVLTEYLQEIGARRQGL